MSAGDFNFRSRAFCSSVIDRPRKAIKFVRPISVRLKTNRTAVNLAAVSD